MTINHINAGIIHTQARMAGLDLSGAIDHARTVRLHSDVDAIPHRATVVRMLKNMWISTDMQTAIACEQSERLVARNAAAAAKFPDQWEKYLAMTNGRQRRDGLAKLRNAAEV